MRFAIMTIAANAGSIICLGIAGWLVMHDKDGWGWFLFFALILGQCVSTKRDK